MKTDLNVFEFWDILCECNIAERGDYIRLLYLIGMGEAAISDMLSMGLMPASAEKYRDRFLALNKIMEEKGIKDSMEEVPF